MIMMIAPLVIEFGLKDHSLAIKCSKPDSHPSWPEPEYLKNG